MFIIYFLPMLIILLDQISKYLIFGLEARSIIGNIIWIQSEQNTGVAFSMFSGNNILFIVVSSFAIIAFIYLLVTKKIFALKLEKIAIAFIIGGAISNLIDRIIFSFVRDFIYLKFINFAVFNVADMAITIGTVLLVATLIFFQKSDNQKEKQND